MLSFFLFTPLFSFASLAAADTGALTDSASLQKENIDPVAIQGYLSGKYVWKKSSVSDEKIRDEDVFGELRLDLSKPQTNRYEFHFFGAGRDDLSSNHDRRTFYPFEDIGDTYRSRTQGYLYEAHLDLNQPFSRVTQLRIGRQDGAREEPVFFDGIAADVAVTKKINITLYGGAAVHFYELNTRWGDDRLGGLGLDYVPWTGAWLNMDYLYADDARNLYDTLNQHDNLLSLKIGQRFTPNLKATAKIRYLNNEQRDMKLRIVDTFPGADLEMQVAYFRQFRAQNELSNEFSPYYDVIGRSNPYYSYDVKVRKFFGVRYAVDLGYFQRALLDSGQEGPFNRPYQRTFAVFDLIDVLREGLSFSFIGEQWKAGPQRFNSTGFDAGYAFKKGKRGPKVNAGTYYSLYKYDYYSSLGERTKVRTYYAKFEYPFAQRYALNGSYEFEKGLEDYQTAKLGIRYEF